MKNHCCLCGELIESYGSRDASHNAAPVATGRCCGECNDTVVIPARIAAFVSFKRLETQRVKKTSSSPLTSTDSGV